MKTRINAATYLIPGVANLFRDVIDFYPRYPGAIDQSNVYPPPSSHPNTSIPLSYRLVVNDKESERFLSHSIWQRIYLQYIRPIDEVVQSGSSTCILPGKESRTWIQEIKGAIIKFWWYNIEFMCFIAAKNTSCFKHERSVSTTIPCSLNTDRCEE